MIDIWDGFGDGGDHISPKIRGAVQNAEDVLGLAETAPQLATDAPL